MPNKIEWDLEKKHLKKTMSATKYLCTAFNISVT